MLTLQTLRDKGGVLLAILIGIALLAFLLGDMLSSSSLLFGSGNKVGTIEGNSINYQDYGIKLDYYTSINDLIYGSSQDVNERATEEAWESLIREELFVPQFKKLGIATSQAESKKMLSPDTPSPIVATLFADPQTGFYSPDYYRNFLETASYDASGARMQLVSYLKSESDFISASQKLMPIISGGYFPTNSDVAFETANMSKSRDIRFIYKKVRSVSDSVVNFTDNDVEKFYESHKNSFFREESRTINYVTFDVNPSQADFLAAQKIVDKLASEFAESSTPKLYAEANSYEKNLSHYYSRGQLDAPLAEFAFSGSDGVYGPILSDRTFSMARVINVRNVMDSIELSHIALLPDQTALADSLMDVLAHGGDFASLAMQYSGDPQTRLNGGQLGIMDPVYLPDEIFDKVVDLPVGKCVKVESANVINIFKLDRKVGNQPKVYLAFVNYRVEPSKATRNDVFNRATKFATTVSGSLDNFVRAGSDSVLDLRVAKVHPADRGVEGIDNSREIVTWAFAKGDDEATSHVMEFGDMFLVAALASSEHRGIAPLDEVREEMADALRSQIKAEYLKNQMKGASLQEVASKLGLEILEAKDVDFNTFSFPEVGFNSGFAGGLTFVKAGTLSNPIVTNDAVFLAEVVAENDKSISSDQVRETLKAESDQFLFQQAWVETLQKAEINDQRYKVYR